MKLLVVNTHPGADFDVDVSGSTVTVRIRPASSPRPAQPGARSPSTPTRLPSYRCPVCYGPSPSCPFCERGRADN